MGPRTVVARARTKVAVPRAAARVRAGSWADWKAMAAVRARSREEVRAGPKAGVEEPVAAAVMVVVRKACKDC